MNRLVTLSETARQFGVSVATVRNWRWRRKHLEFVKIGHSVRVKQGSIDKLIKCQTVPPRLDEAMIASEGN